MNRYHADRVINVAAIQILPTPGDPGANVLRSETFVRRAVREQGADLVILPECALTGYASPAWQPEKSELLPGESPVVFDTVPKPPAANSNPGHESMSLAQTREMAESVPGKSSDHFAALAAELGAYIVWTLHERRGGCYHNAAVLLCPDGQVAGTYRKVHINKYERQMGWTNGEGFFVWPCEVRKMTFNLGIMICYDREVPEAARCLAVLGADLIAIPQATSCTAEIAIHRDQIRVRAYENEVYVAMANWAGPVFKGHSMIVDPAGEILRLGGHGEETVTAACDLETLRKHRAAGIYGRHHRQPNAYGPLLQK